MSILRKEDHDHKEIKGGAYQLVEKAIHEGHIALAASGVNLDKDRKPIDTIVIHHTNNKPGMTLDRLNAMHLLRIYGRYFANPTDSRELHLKGQPIWSGYFYKELQVFWGYHWLIQEDGTSEHILDDKYVGWHAGNWDINTRSIGICIDDDLSEKEPYSAVLKAVARVIQEHYPQVEPKAIVGHCVVNKQIVCPGHLFHERWQKKLLKLLAK